MTNSNKSLNKAQLEAVGYHGGPLLIIAGAGTGKTTVVTERVKYLIKRELAKPSEILALTFTDKAAREMEERIDVSLPYGYTQMWISTFHAFCDRLIRSEALQIGLDPRFKLMTQAESIQFVRKNLFNFELDYFRPRGNPTKFLSGMLKHFSRLQDEDISPVEYMKWAKCQKSNIKYQSEEEKLEMKKWLELSKAYEKYEELKVKDGVMDFGDLIVKTLKLLRDRPNVLKRYREKFKYILVDEFQDVNYAQNELAILIAGKGARANITATGDDDQSIYRFRGAAVSNIVHFKRTYPKAKTIVLTENYRSAQYILDKSYELIKNNNPDRLEVVENIDKRLISKTKPSFKSEDLHVKFIHENRVENEADKVAREIGRLVNQVNSANPDRFDKPVNLVNRLTDSLNYRDIAVLVRANNHSEPFIRAFQRHAIPYQFLGPGRLFKQEEIIDLISYLKVLYDFDDSLAFYRLLSSDYFEISARDLIRISNFAKRANLSLFEACEKLDDLVVSGETQEKIAQLVEIVNGQFKLIKKESAGQLLYNFLERANLLQKLLNPKDAGAEKKAKNISKLFDKLKSYETDHEDASVTAVVDWIELSSELGESPLAADTDWTDMNAVNILTVHSAKGLEFPVVFLVNLVSQRFPSVERREQIPIPDEIIKETLPEGDFHLQEERRLFYVGMTRAQELLYFSAADYYGEGKREKGLSPFIFEALGNDALSSEGEVKGDEQLSFLDYQLSSESEEDSQSEIGLQKFHIDYLSYSQIETFRICPLHYKLRYVLRIPTPSSPALSFGISMHEALRRFYELARSGARQSEKTLLKTLKNVWVSEGYKSKSHENKSFAAARKYLKDYYKKEFDYKNLPLAVEENFKVPLPYVKSERRLIIGGKIDRVDNLGKGKIEVLDYKTGENVPTQKQVDDDLQLTFYALAAASIKESPFLVKAEDIKLSLYYFDGQQKISTARTGDQLKEAEKEIYDWREKIETSDFNCSGHFFCKSCEYSLMCNAS